MNRQIIYNLVENDTAPQMPVRFVGLDLHTYTSITLHIKYSNGTRASRMLSVHPTDPELGLVTWIAGDLKRGRHTIEFELITSDDKKSTYPKKYPIILDVRGDIA